MPDTVDSEQINYVPVDAVELQMLVTIAHSLIEAGILMHNPPMIITPNNNQQTHQDKINYLISQAGNVAIKWGLKVGVIKQEEPSSPLVQA